MPAPVPHRLRLGNGLRVLVAPDHLSPVVSVAVLYDVGHRSEPEGREGFAHLFEHMMFQGSENFPKLAHGRMVNAYGGTFNGTTHRDHTCYYQVLPAGSLETALRLEADRMRAPLLDRDALANQVAVVEQEIRRKVLDNPYGGLPSPYLQAVMFDDPANSHDGWGAVERLRTVTVQECRTFFEEYYCPANALLVVCGDASPELVRELAERHFGGIPGGAAPAGPPACPGPTPEERHRVHHHPAMAMQAMAVGWRLPDPSRDLAEYEAAVLLAEVLAARSDSVLHARLVRDSGIVHQVSMTVGLNGTPFGSRDPDVLALVMLLNAETAPGAVLDSVDRELERLAHDGPCPELLTRRAATWRTRWMSSLDSWSTRAQTLGAFELLHGDAELAWELPERIREVTAEAVAGAAARLAEQPRRWVAVLPGAEERSEERSGAELVKQAVA